MTPHGFMFATLLILASFGAPAGGRESSVLLESTRSAATTAGIGQLDAANMAAETSEIRVWVGFGVVEPNLLLRLRVNRHGEVAGEMLLQFSGDFRKLSQEDVADFRRDYARVCKDLRIGADVYTCVADLPRATDWKAVHEQLMGLGITRLPDESALPEPRTRIKDGVAVVVEVREGPGYRTYEYSNPRFRPEPEAQAADQIIKVVGQLWSRAIHR